MRLEFELEIEKGKEIEEEKEKRNQNLTGPKLNPGPTQTSMENPTQSTSFSGPALSHLPLSRGPSPLYPRGPPTQQQTPALPLSPAAHIPHSRSAQFTPFAPRTGPSAPAHPLPRARPAAPASPASLPVSLSNRARWQDLPLPPPKIVAGLPAPPVPRPAAPWVIPDHAGPLASHPCPFSF